MDYGAYDAAQYSAQANPEASGALLIAILGIMLFFFLIIFAVYVYMAISMMKIAKKTNTPNGWFAWIPFLNMWLLVQIAGKPWWWFLLMFVPLANIVVSVMLWMEISKVVGKPDWLGVLIVVPIANIVLPGYLAFSKDDNLNVALPELKKIPENG